MAKLFGRVTVVVNGTVHESMPGATLKLGGINKTPVNTDQLITHSIEEYVHSMISATILLTPGAPIEDLRNLESSTGIFQADNGIEYTLTGLTANTSGDWEISKEGLPVELFGNAAKPS